MRFNSFLELYFVRFDTWKNVETKNFKAFVKNLTFLVEQKNKKIY